MELPDRRDVWSGDDRMRLICPNCDAIYEVDDSAIPETGRDVQCSNCGHGWFQLPPEAEALLGEELMRAAPEEEEDGPDPTPRTMPETREETPARRTLDEDLLAVLREEAEREAAQRRAEAPPVETQVEMDMPPAAAPPPPAGGPLAGAARRLAQMKGIDPDARPAAPAKPGSRRDLLPDIEEINSSLSPAEAAEQDAADEPEAAAARGSAFRSGFSLMLLVAAIVVTLYAMAPSLADQIPAAAPWLEGYTGAIDGLRLWLDGVLRSATAFVTGLTGQQGG